MHIKTITISGFKTYRDQVAVEPFSPRHNVIVGRNGSGKSNFFSAIRFVLSDKYTSMAREERQSLLHHGTSQTTTMSAYVEIVFDNSDGRFPTNNPELYLRRTIGLKKDEYSLDKKSASKAEVMNLLESAGFSKSNPYYIVPQGRITHLTSIDDKERLNLLKEVAGTRVYEQKRAESSKIMEETDAKREQIAGLLTYIEERLDELAEEQKELKEFQEKDKERRCLEYRLHQRELDDVSAALDKVEGERANDVHVNNEKRQEFNSREQTVQTLEQDLTSAKHSLATTSIALRQYETEMAELVRARTEIECLVTDFQQAGVSGEQRRKEIGAELERLEERIEQSASRLMDLGNELDERVAEEREAREVLDNTNSQLQVLYAKQGRSRQFATQAARDKYLNDEIKSLKAYEKTQQKRVEDLSNDVEGAKSKLEEVMTRSRSQAAEEADRRESLRTMGEESSGLKAEMDAMQEQKKSLWREDGRLGQTVSDAKTSMEEAQRSLQGLMDKDTSNGLRNIPKIAKRLGLDGVYGPLYELFEVSDKYKTAVEVTAAGSLLHVVVDNDETATKLLEVMNKSSKDKENSGRVTFIPLNRLKSVQVNYPKADDALPMISKLKYDRRFSMAFEHVFARTIICQNLATAASYTRSHGLNSVTIEGDRVDRKGTLTGGYHDVRRSRLDSAKLLKKWRETYETDSARHGEVKEGISKLEQKVTAVMGQISALDARRRQILDQRAHLASQSSWVAREEEQSKQRLSRLENALDEAQTELKDASAKLQSYAEELKTPMRQELTNAELRTLETLTADVEVQKKSLVEASAARSKAASEKAALEIELTESQRRRRNELRAKLDDLEGDAGSGLLQAGEVEQRQKELKNLVSSIEELVEQVQTSEARAQELNTKIAEVSQQLDEEQARQMENTRAIMKVSKNAERYLTKRQTLITRKEECSNAIRDLGILPEEAYTNNVNTAIDKLVKRLHKINESLKKFTHVNKKAFEQFANFTNERQTLLSRRDELDTSADSIEELIQTLDQRKDEAIERTFKQVSKYFEEVFEQLVPAGRGRLVMQKKADGYMPEEETEETDPNRLKTEVDNYTGVSIRVSFNSKREEGQRISQLSGGQKSLVALATVFAIQKCDPAPFYLFDEIDANLDTQYRTAVAAMIHDLSESAQFITTTFRPEMCNQADKFYGVYFNREKVSNVMTIKKDDAFQFLETPAGDKE